ncbi:MAG: hypothetical protein ABJF05_12795 [Paracoccaceae bacterium]
MTDPFHQNSGLDRAGNRGRNLVSYAVTETVALSPTSLVCSKVWGLNTKKAVVQMELPHPLSYQDVADLLGKRGVDTDRSTLLRWVWIFGPGLAKRTECHLQRQRRRRIAREYEEKAAVMTLNSISSHRSASCNQINWPIAKDASI